MDYLACDERQPRSCNKGPRDLTLGPPNFTAHDRRRGGLAWMPHLVFAGPLLTTALPPHACQGHICNSNACLTLFHTSTAANNVTYTLFHLFLVALYFWRPVSLEEAVAVSLSLPSRRRSFRCLLPLSITAVCLITNFNSTLPLNRSTVTIHRDVTLGQNPSSLSRVDPWWPTKRRNVSIGPCRRATAT
jgi:hypothetical protein